MIDKQRMTALDDDIRFDNSFHLSNVTKRTQTGIAEKLWIDLEKGLKPNEQYLKAKRLSHTLDLIDNKILQSRLVMGRLPLITS